ncbi:hypothetical protein L3Q72_12790 [Vibrio sp. JC009]|uniref:hypothetical protein n=1 Tax=Vibrio sp. JC009 TaxID=2912314 RepID=UPI0023B07AF5|nr:hypothetical protein [Vibrio sp. JC009]WED21493.1 hypothetical protein L3Q72_12790 [Vibrio sp. JC009]
MEMKKKTVALLVGMSLASASAFAGELNSLTSEVTVNDYDAGVEKTEWTIGKGSYKLSESNTFLFDIDKDYTSEPSEARTEGWDTQFGIAQSVGEFAGFDASINYLYRYDAAWNATDNSDSWSQNQYIIAPYFDKGIEIAGKEFSLGIELWAQVGDKDGNKLKNLSGAETNFYLDGDLSDNWSLSLAWYNFNYYDSSENEYDYQAGTEDYLTYSLPLGSGLTFSVENYVEAYYTPDTEETIVYAHVEPKLSYSNALNDNITLKAAVAYEVVRWDYTNTAGVTSTNSRDNNEMEFVLGVTIK